MPIFMPITGDHEPTLVNEDMGLLVALESPTASLVCLHDVPGEEPASSMVLL